MKMDELELPVSFNGREYKFPLRIEPHGFVYNFVVQVHKVEVIFERDESHDFRAVIYNQDKITGKLPEKGLLEAITNVLQLL